LLEGKTKTLWGSDSSETERKNKFAVDSRDINLHVLYQRVMRDPSEENHKLLKAELENRMRVDSIF